MCVLALSATLGKGGEKMLLHSLESEEGTKCQACFPLSRKTVEVDSALHNGQ